jgi:hypothetical protein
MFLIYYESDRKLNTAFCAKKQSFSKDKIMGDKMIKNYFVVNHFVFLVAARPRWVSHIIVSRITHYVLRQHANP